MSQYMKGCHILVMQYVGTLTKPSFVNSTTYGPKISITSSGLPRCIPLYFRRLIRERDPQVIRIVLTVFNLYRVMDYPGKLKLSTITAPSTFDPKDPMAKEMLLFIRPF